MTRYLISRLIQLVPTVFGIYTLAFFLMRVLPGDPATFIIGVRDDTEAVDNLRRIMRLDEPLLNQYLGFLGDGLRGDFGRSYITAQPVSEMIANAFPLTLRLALSATFFAVSIGIPLGVIAAVYRNSFWDSFSRLIALFGVSVPVFWLGIQLQILFGLQLRLLPISGSSDFQHIILPAITASGGMLALLTRMTRSSLLEELNQDYVRTARSKGLRERLVTFRHALRNALLPVVTVWGGSLAGLLSGTLLVEVIFNWTGMGRLLVQAINTRDYPLMQGLIIVLALLYAGVNLVVDLLYPLIDPRIRYDK
jgi:ABC-type dipeptide/oligopeptide/nickel transport system permease component